MENQTKIRVNYFVNGLLAQGGEVRIDEANLIFSPTSSLDRAMGATDTAIPLKNIRGMEHSGNLLRTLHVKTDQKDFKFEGTQARELAKMLETTLKQKGLFESVKVEKKTAAVFKTMTPNSSLPTCPKCEKMLRVDFVFCPYCATAVKKPCQHCHKPIEENWIACAYCGRSTKSAAA